MKEMSTLEERKASFVPRVCIFGGKAFATYIQAKRIVKFITDVGATVNHDPDIGDLLKVHRIHLMNKMQKNLKTENNFLSELILRCLGCLCS